MRRVLLESGPSTDRHLLDLSLGGRRQRPISDVRLVTVLDRLRIYCHRCVEIALRVGSPIESGRAHLINQTQLDSLFLVQGSDYVDPIVGKIGDDLSLVLASLYHVLLDLLLLHQQLAPSEILIEVLLHRHRRINHLIVQLVQALRIEVICARILSMPHRCPIHNAVIVQKENFRASILHHNFLLVLLRGPLPLRLIVLEKGSLSHRRQFNLVDEACVAVGAAWRAHSSHVGPDLGLGPHHEALGVEQVIAGGHPRHIFVDEVFDTYSARGLRLLDVLAVLVEVFGRKLVHFAEARLSSIRFIELLSLRAPLGAPDLPPVVRNLQHLLLLKVFLLLNVVAANAFTDLDDGDDDPWHKKDDAKRGN